MQDRQNLKARKSAETRARLIATARVLFGAAGYAATGTEEIVAGAAVTRGALYFHFADKSALFAAVLDEVAREIAAAIADAAEGEADPIAALCRGAAAYVDACCDPTRRRIYLADGPSVLGAAQWHAAENRYSRPLLRAGVATALARPGAVACDAEALTALLSGAMTEAAIWLADAVDPAAARRRALAALDVMLARLFAAPA